MRRILCLIVFTKESHLCTLHKMLTFYESYKHCHNFLIFFFSTHFWLMFFFSQSYLPYVICSMCFFFQNIYSSLATDFVHKCIVKMQNNHVFISSAYDTQNIQPESINHFSFFFTRSKCTYFINTIRQQKVFNAVRGWIELMSI